MPLRNHPTIVYSPNHPNLPNLPNSLTMLDLASYKIGKPSDPGEILNIFAQNPFNSLIPNFFNSSTPSGTILAEKSGSNYFAATIETPKDSVLMLKASFHPFWQATIDGKNVEKFMVEPSFMAIKVPSGKHDVEFKYYPSLYKQLLMILGLLTLPSLYIFLKRYRNFL
ncbi:YfhO family protein [Candidatus Gottesmanbacteria bacterium]|nr:YfhO family protein [Candidatus Gottesmanbacteria bacterium]